jgi:hypothetical protein
VTLKLDGKEVTETPKPIDDSAGVLRLRVSGGRHVLEASKPVGLSVIGYGAYTSYAYPGGLNLKLIAKTVVN